MENLMNMKINKILIIIAFILTPMLISAQVIDERQREANTVVADVLNQLPANNNYELFRYMDELCRTGENGIMSIAMMLSPVEQASNANIEYALDGLSHFVNTGRGYKYQQMVANAMLSAIEKHDDVDIKAFLISLFKNLGKVEQLDMLAPYLYDENLSEITLQTVLAIPESDPFVERLVIEQKLDKKMLANAAASKQLESTEDILISWLNNADTETCSAIYYALSQLGSAKSLTILSKNAKSLKYRNDPTDVTACYVDLVNKLAIEKDTANVAEEIDRLLKVKRSNIKIAGLNASVSLYGRNACPTLIKYVKNKDAQVREVALSLLKPYYSNALLEELVKVAKNDAVKADIIMWMSNFNAKSQMEFIQKQTKTKNKDLAEAVIVTLCNIGDENDIMALFPLATENNREVMVKNLAAYKNMPCNLLSKCIQEGNDEQIITALKVMDYRRLYPMYNDVFKKCVNKEVSDEVRAAAYKALKNVVRINEISFLQAQLVLAKDIYLKDVQDAMIALFSNKNSFTPDVLNSFIDNYKNQTPSIQARYYPVLASNEKLISLNIVLDAYNDGINEKEAFNALTTMEHKSMIDVMFDIAKNDELNKDKALQRYVYLVNKYEDSEVVKITSFRKALELNPNDDVKNMIIKAIETTNSYQGIMLAAEFLNDEATQQTAANVVLNIAYKNPEYNGKEIIELLNRIKEIFDDTDALYKKTQIDEHLTKIAEVPAFTLSEDEKNEGFEILFDGTNLDKWVGDKTNYIVKNGNIYVTADYGDDGNLYTEKEYSDFIYRFEFCYLRSGVNNGVGIRTPMNVDAAYEGMEIQILDHDAPIYKGLREYQVHGSVYGIVPAERIVFPELGTWNTEEIMVKGDHIKVTVNGQLILDADIRKACNGHNVAPDGSDNNPYTVDKHNHPGLFNKKGFISFCGHGEGLLIRNVRIKEL